MKPLICIYCEGNDTKMVAVEKIDGKIILQRAVSMDIVQPGSAKLDSTESEINFDDKDNQVMFDTGLGGVSNENLITSALAGLNLNKYLFVPGVTEPTIYYHVYESAKKEPNTKLTGEIITDIQESKSKTVTKETMGYLELSDGNTLSVFLGDDIPCVKLINNLARFNRKRFYKIPTIKSAELTLAYYVAKRKKFFPDDYSLIVYIGKEYSKLIFLHGRKLKHIGSTLDIGTLNLHTYDVYFSKILLEMENSNIPTLDNIIVCGEDDSENLILSFYGTFPEANVSRLEFDDIDVSQIDENTLNSISSFSVPFAIATEFYDEESKEYSGINLLPKFIKENQKMFQFAWHGYAMFPLLFILPFYLTFNILTNSNKISTIEKEIQEQTFKQRENQEILNQINFLEGKIGGFDQTQSILDSAAKGTEVWDKILTETSNFISTKRNLWVTKIEQSKEDSTLIVMEGYALNRNVLTEFAYDINSALLRGVFFEKLRDKNSYKFVMTFRTFGLKPRTE